MRRSVGMVALSGLLAAALAGCQKIEEPYVGELQLTRTELKDTVPAEYGKLVGVGAQADALQLLFERADQALVVVTLDTHREALINRVIVIPRQ